MSTVRNLSLGATLASLTALAAFVACGGGGTPAQDSSKGSARSYGDAGFDDQARCDFRGRVDREVSETAGPGAVLPNVRRVYQLMGTGDERRKVLVCREIDTNLDGVKDVVRTYNEKGESLHEEADSNYDGKIDVWVTFTSGRISKEQLDSDYDGQPDVWKYYVGGQLSRIQRDSNKDGKPDRWEFYTSGKLERMGVDLDFDGHVDRWDHDEEARASEEMAAKSSPPPDAGAALPTPVPPPVQVADAGAAPNAVAKHRKK